MTHSQGDRGRVAAREAEALLERLRICALSALSALDSGDHEGWRGALAERDTLMTRAAPLLETVRTASATGTGLDAAKRRLLDTLTGVQAADQRLATELQRRRSALGAELRQLQQQAHPGAYTVPRTAGHHLDLRR